MSDAASDDTFPTLSDHQERSAAVVTGSTAAAPPTLSAAPEPPPPPPAPGEQAQPMRFEKTAQGMIPIAPPPAPPAQQETAAEVPPEQTDGVPEPAAVIPDAQAEPPKAVPEWQTAFSALTSQIENLAKVVTQQAQIQPQAAIAQPPAPPQPRLTDPLEITARSHLGDGAGPQQIRLYADMMRQVAGWQPHLASPEQKAKAEHQIQMAEMMMGQIATSVAQQRQLDELRSSVEATRNAPTAYQQAQESLRRKNLVTIDALNVHAQKTGKWSHVIDALKDGRLSLDRLMGPVDFSGEGSEWQDRLEAHIDNVALGAGLAASAAPAQTTTPAAKTPAQPATKVAPPTSTPAVPIGNPGAAIPVDDVSATTGPPDDKFLTFDQQMAFVADKMRVSN